MHIQLLSVKLPKLVENRKRRNVLTNKSTKYQKIIEGNDKGEEHKYFKCDIVMFFIIDVCPACFCERGYKTNGIIESSKKVITKNVYNYLYCKLPSLVTEPCQEYACDNFFHYLCQNDDDTETFADKFD